MVAKFRSSLDDDRQPTENELSRVEEKSRDVRSNKGIKSNKSMTAIEAASE